jgi:hypothetical protein
MKTYARLLNGTVAELFSTASNIAGLFNPALIWVDVTATPAVQVGWVQQANGSFVAPTAATVPVGASIAVVSIANLQATLSLLQSQLTALSSASGSGAGSG